MTFLTRYRRLLYVLIGATAGYLYYVFIGCASGTCPITSNPYLSTAYGAGMGLLLGWSTNNKAKGGQENQS